MEGPITLGILLFIGYVLYESGKCVGSRKAYRVSPSRRRRRR
jgi:hypothetical protein